MKALRLADGTLVPTYGDARSLGWVRIPQKGESGPPDDDYVPWRSIAERFTARASR